MSSQAPRSRLGLGGMVQNTCPGRCGITSWRPGILRAKGSDRDSSWDSAESTQATGQAAQQLSQGIGFVWAWHSPPNGLALSRFARHRGEPKNPSRLPDINKVYWSPRRQIRLQRRVIRRARPWGSRMTQPRLGRSPYVEGSRTSVAPLPCRSTLYSTLS